MCKATRMQIFGREVWFGIISIPKKKIGVCCALVFGVGGGSGVKEEGNLTESNYCVFIVYGDQGCIEGLDYRMQGLSI